MMVKLKLELAPADLLPSELWSELRVRVSADRREVACWAAKPGGRWEQEVTRGAHCEAVMEKLVEGRWVAVAHHDFGRVWSNTAITAVPKVGSGKGGAWVWLWTADSADIH